MRVQGLAPAGGNERGTAVPVGVRRRRVGAVLLATAVSGALAAGLLLALGVANPVPCLLAGAAVAIASGLVVLLASRFGMAPAHWSGAPSLRALGVLMTIRGASWAILAIEAADGTVGVPALGDGLAVIAGVASMVALVATARADSARARLLTAEIASVCSTLLLGIWVLALRPAQDRVGIWVLLYCLVVAGVQVATLVTGLLVSAWAFGPRRSLPTILAVSMVTVGDVACVVSAAWGPRHVPDAALAVWCLGWPLLAWRVLTALGEQDVTTTQLAAARRRALSSAVAGSLGAAGSLVAITGWVSGWSPPPDELVVGGLLVSAVALHIGHGFLLGKDRIRLMAGLAEQALHDPWTGLANRRGLSDRIRSLPSGSEWAVLAIDLDGFKSVNDIHGHARGDTVLAEVADVLRRYCPPRGLVARTGGDEFAMLVPGDVESGREIGRQVVGAVPQALEPHGLVVPITASVGVGRLAPVDVLPADPGVVVAPVVLAPVVVGPPVPAAGDGVDPLTPLVEAAAALRAAKAGGRNRVQVYPGHVARLRERRLLVERRLREALRADDVTTVGQPLVDLATGRLVAVEALARWDDAVLGAVPPSEFVPVAEECGLVAALGTHVLRSSVAGFAANGLVGSRLRLGVNVSPIELRDPAFPQAVERILSAEGFAPWHLTIEVTEAVLVEKDDPAVRVLGALNDLGVRVAIDDFGTGYSALGYLRRLPVQALKLDRSLLLEARTTVRTRHVLAGLVDLARRLGVTVVVEGVEDEHAARLAVEVGATLGQGFLLGAPMPWAEVAARFHADPPASVADRTG